MIEENKEEETPKGIGNEKVTPEVIAQLRAAFCDELPLFKYKDKWGKFELVFKAITHDLLARVRVLVKEETLKNNLLPVNEVNNKLFDECVIWPSISEDDKLNLPSGFVSNVVKDIQERSGFLDVDIFERPLRPDQYTEVIRDFAYWDYAEDEELDKLKEKSRFPLFRVLIGRYEFIVRPMTKADWNVLTAAQDELLTLCKAVTEYPKVIPWDEIPAGIVETLSKAITRISGWSDEAEVSEI